jgi:hypothetical protein
VAVHLPFEDRKRDQADFRSVGGSGLSLPPDLDQSLCPGALALRRSTTSFSPVARITFSKINRRRLPGTPPRKEPSGLPGRRRYMLWRVVLFLAL